MQHAPHLTNASTTLTVFIWCILAAAVTAYLAAARDRRPGRRAWNHWRTVSFMSAMALLAIAASPPLVDWARQDLRGHMTRHVLIGMLAPIGVVLGTPVTLLLRSLPVPAARLTSAALTSRTFATLTHPVTALTLDAGGMYLLLLTPLYAAAHANDILFAALHVHFLAAGTLFAHAIAGTDPTPHRRSFRLRVAVLFTAIAMHSTLAKTMYAHGLPGISGHDPAEIQAAAQIMYYGGDLAELLLAVALFGAWYQRRAREQIRKHQHGLTNVCKGVPKHRNRDE